MTKLFGVDVAAEVAGAMPESELTSATLRKYTPGTATNGSDGSWTSYSCHGIPPTTKLQMLGAQAPNVSVGTGTARIVGKRLTDQGVRPGKGDQLIMDSVTYVIDDVGWDSYKAMFTCKVRGS